MRPDERRTLESMKDKRWTTSLDLARRLGLSPQFARGCLYNLHHVSWVDRGTVNAKGGRLWKITEKGQVALAQRQPPPTSTAARSTGYREALEARERKVDRPSHAKAKRPKVGPHTITLDQYKAQEAKAGDRMVRSTLSQPLGTVSRGYKAKAGRARTRKAT